MDTSVTIGQIFQFAVNESVNDPDGEEDLVFFVWITVEHINDWYHVSEGYVGIKQADSPGDLASTSLMPHTFTSYKDGVGLANWVGSLNWDDIGPQIQKDYLSQPFRTELKKYPYIPQEKFGLVTSALKEKIIEVLQEQP